MGLYFAGKIGKMLNLSLKAAPTQERGKMCIRDRQLYAHDEKGELHSIAVLDRKLFEKESKGAGVLGTVDYEKASKDNAISVSYTHLDVYKRQV